ncbi:diguanylate cyclase [Neobacillus sp. SuZ13]|uniref:diguanylate cyclase domain-containing protein n=1 Tax=Neobacillus sp. SuZ13 TaxID=3047875 RepID=UPI0024BF98D5|nr:diguanylate cyclase [Neobacillus sp. SuZ13]WHY68132.1 diguanylate cyclase [Neobacillus sp. SuZ13]
MSENKNNLESLNKIDLFFQLFNDMSDLVYLTKVGKDGQFSYVLANEPAQNFSGLTSKSFGKPIEEVLPEEVFHIIEEKYKQAITARESITYEDRIVVPPSYSNRLNNKYSPGQFVYWESTITPLWNQEEECTHLLAVVRDVTERKERENELKRMNDRFELVWNSTADAMYTFDRHQNFVSVNKSFINLLGWTEGEILNDWTISIIPKNSKDDLKEIIKRVKSGEVVPSHEVQRITKEGKLIDVLASYSPIYDGNGNWDGAVVVYKDISERKKYEDQLKHHALHDYLTGMPNRNFFSIMLKEEMTRAEKSKRTLAVFYLDIDKFKVINDTLGHDIGDELLKEFSRRVKACIREKDLLARIGGDEFGILITNLHDKKKSIEIAERILSSFRNNWVIEGHHLKVASSIGISFYSDPYKQDEKLLLKQADIALYKAKGNGRGNYQVY